MNASNAPTLFGLRRAAIAVCLVVGTLAISVPAASAEDSTYRATVKVKQWDEEARRAAAQKAANKGCRNDDHDRAKIKVRKGDRVAAYRYDCVAGTAIDL